MTLCSKARRYQAGLSEIVTKFEDARVQCICYIVSTERLIPDKNQSTSTGLAIGIAIGLAIAAMDNIGAGIAIGIAIGMTFGAAADARSKRDKRDERKTDDDKE